jgi:microcystin-dependent protein
MSDRTDFYPVGGVALFAGTLPENVGWLLCDGREFNTRDYEELFAAIGNIYGGASGAFRIPDYRGRFLRGETSLESIGTVQEYATKLPGKPFKATFKHLPVAHKTSHGVTKTEDTGYDNDNTIEQDTCTSGGDPESRPINVYLNCYIKARS